jgi:COP9 signalosome complex subunit 4
LGSLLSITAALKNLTQHTPHPTLVTAARVYANITFAELGSLLSITAADAETLVAKMIGDGALRATIDQVSHNTRVKGIVYASLSTLSLWT